MKLTPLINLMEPPSQGQPGEQWTMFFKDPSGNNLEFKAMTKPSNLFAKYNVDDVEVPSSAKKTAAAEEASAEVDQSDGTGSMCQE